MYRIVTAAVAGRRMWVGTVALLFTLYAAGCARAPATGGGVAPAALGEAAEATPATDAAAGASPAVAPAHSAPQPAATSQTSAAPRTLVAYYFHWTMRCATCLSIERQSREALALAYGGELDAGTLEWHAVNVEEPGNEHFTQDFALQTQSLVLVERAGPRVLRWKLLPRVWELVDDPYGFEQYVVSEVALFMGGG